MLLNDFKRRRRHALRPTARELPEQYLGKGSKIGFPLLNTET
jgi:hypothetical protein